MDFEFYMEKAYQLALEAFNDDEVPIGCVIVLHDKIIGYGRNKRNTAKNALYHAEIIAIHEACRFMGDWRLEDCTLFVTVEPCPMCAGAIVQARIKEVVYATHNKKAGCAGSIINILNEPAFNHQVSIVHGVLESKCSQLMSQFFKKFRKTKSQILDR